MVLLEAEQRLARPWLAPQSWLGLGTPDTLSRHQSSGDCTTSASREEYEPREGRHHSGRLPETTTDVHDRHPRHDCSGSV